MQTLDCPPSTAPVSRPIGRMWVHDYRSLPEGPSGGMPWRAFPGVLDAQGALSYQLQVGGKRRERDDKVAAH